jgi:hypothetical protein
MIFSLSIGLGPFVMTQTPSAKVGAAVKILGTATFTVVDPFRNRRQGAPGRHHGDGPRADTGRHALEERALPGHA